MFFFVAHQFTHLQCVEDPHCDTGSAHSSENLQMPEDLNLGELFTFTSPFFPLAFSCAL